MKFLPGCRFALAASTALWTMPLLAEAPAQEQPATSAPSLEDQFRDPPNSARPRVWWHWMNGNITKDGIAKDLAWMKRVGIGGLQNFDANIKTPQIVDKRLVYMTPEWKDAFRFAAREADRLGLELAIASSPGWSETGGPWVPPQDALKKLVWSETAVVGGKRFLGKIASPPAITGPFQTIKANPEIGLALSGGDMPDAAPPFYADVAVLAVPDEGEAITARPSYKDAAGKPIDGTVLTDTELESAIEVSRPTSGTALLQITYPTATTVRSATLFMPGAGTVFFGGNVLPRLEASDDGTTWRTVAEIPQELVPTTVSFAPVTARQFRIVFNRPKGGVFSFPPPPPGVDLSDAGGVTEMMAPKPLKVGHLRLSSLNRIDRGEAKAGFAVLPDYYAISGGVPEAKGVAADRVIDVTSRLRADGTLDWTPPKGRWRVLRIGYSLLGTVNHPAPREATGLEVDKFDAGAVRRYLEHYIGMYKDAAGAALVGSRGVRAIVNDSIEVGAANWTPQMVAQFKRLRGYDPTPWLPALTGMIIASREQSDRFLYDYRRTLADLMASEHYGTVAKVAHEHGLKVYGEALETGRPSLGDDMAMRRYADVPMAALWTFARNMDANPSYLADMKGAASVAHIYGQNLVAAESMTSILSPWAFGPSDLKRVIDLEFVSGINLPIVHTSVHAPTDDKKPGLSLSMFGQYFNRHEAWAELAKPWVDYLARNSLMLQQGRNVADVAYFYGEEAPLTGLYGNSWVRNAPKSVAYDFINAEALTGALANDGEDLVTPGGARYRALYLGGSSRQMTLSTLSKLATLVEGGATVIGAKPVGNPSLSGTNAEFDALVARLWSAATVTRVGKGRVIASTDIESALAEAGIAPDFHFSGGQADSEIPFLHRKLGEGSDGGDSYFIVNRKDRTETIEAHFRVTGKAPELWRAETGTAEPVSYRIENGATVVPLTLAPDESIHVVFRKPAATPSLTLTKLEPIEAGKIEAPWKVAFEPNRGAPATATFQTLEPLDRNTDPRIKYFSGIATYTNSFNTPKGWKRGQPLWLDLGEAREVAEVAINGSLAGYAWHAPYRIDISAAAKPGRNTLQVRVANLWVNRLVGDAQPQATRITWTASKTYTAKAPLRRSGLVGPVKLLMGREE